jgi:cell division protein FtsL|tara:strand:- start:275 stop:454 length:180 start_codon:yes stop_codon:yes gene_type:complete
MIKPNKDEIIVIIIMVAMVIGFLLGVLSTKAEMQSKQQDIETLLEIVETQEELIDKLLK